jgi:hypothetical protein
MYRLVLTLAILLTSAVAQDAAISRRVAETLGKADKLFGERYALAKSDPRTEYVHEPSPSSIRYRHGNTLVVQLDFAPDGSVAMLQLLPEAGLSSLVGMEMNVPAGFAIDPRDVEWLIDSGNQLQPLGGRVIGEGSFGPNSGSLCFQSGANNYCSDFFANGTVSHYWRTVQTSDGSWHDLLKTFSINYRRTVSGIIEQVGSEEDAALLKIRQKWYRVRKEQNGASLKETKAGSIVSITVTGCPDWEGICSALPAAKD